MKFGDNEGVLNTTHDFLGQTLQIITNAEKSYETTYM
jgi:hypothetical protein